MKIGIDVHSLGSGKGGNETYYRYLLEGLSACDRRNQYVLFGTREGMLHFPSNDFSNFHWHSIAASSPYLRIPVSMPRAARHERIEIFHAQFILPPFLRCKSVVAIFDITYEHYPEHFSAYQRLWSKILIRSSAKRADHVVTVSEFSKRDISRTYGIDEEKITVTPLGADKMFFPRDTGIARELLAREYAIHEQFILYLGRLQARKNLVRLVEAYARVRRAGFPHKLVLAGRPDFQFEPVTQRIRDLKLEQQVILPGYVPAVHIPFLYSAADLFVFPSFYEGFGLPVVEAMACGTPVITSFGSSLEEVAGGAALLVDPNDEVSIAQAMRSALSDAALRQHLGQAGLKRSTSFSAETTAQKTVAVYEALLGIKSSSAPAIGRPPERVLQDSYSSQG